jgi:hypothetical protein
VQLGLLLQREGPDGGWQLVRCDRGAPCVRAGDALQLTVRPEQPGFLMVAAGSGGQLEILYPLVGQSGAVRADWAYALPDPAGHYALDGQPTRLAVIAGREPWPRSRAARQAMVRAAMRHRSRTARRPPVSLQLRDGRPVRVPVTRFEAPGLVVARIDLL